MLEDCWSAGVPECWSATVLGTQPEGIKLKHNIILLVLLSIRSTSAFSAFFLQWYFDIPEDVPLPFFLKWKYTIEKQTYFYIMYRLNVLYHIADIVDYNIFLDLCNEK